MGQPMQLMKTVKLLRADVEGSESVKVTYGFFLHVILPLLLVVATGISTLVLARKVLQGTLGSGETNGDALKTVEVWKIYFLAA